MSIFTKQLVWPCMLCMENSSVLTCEQALGETWAGIEGEPARMALNFKWRVQILDAKY